MAGGSAPITVDLAPFPQDYLYILTLKLGFNAVLVLFSSSLLRINRRGLQHDSTNSSGLILIGVKLQIAIEVLQRFGNIRPVQRAKKIAEKLFQLYVNLGKYPRKYETFITRQVHHISIV